MPELPEGWTLDVRTLPTGVRIFNVSGAGGVVMNAATYPAGGAYIEYDGLEDCDAFCSGSGYRNSETVSEADELRARAALLEALADDLEERDRSTSRDVLVRFGHDADGRTYAFECDYRCPVSSEVQVWTRGHWQDAIVAEHGTGGYEGKRAAAKLVKVAGADE